MKRLLVLFLLGAAGAVLFRTFIFEGIYIKTNSMAPTLPKGTHIFVNKTVFFFREPKRGDVVLLETPQEPDKGLVKRIIAIGGDTIAIKNKRVYLNRMLKEEPYVQYVRPDEKLVGDNLPPIVVPEGYVFVMGDNRDESGDSRDWKDQDGDWIPYVPVDSILGLVKSH